MFMVMATCHKIPLLRCWCFKMRLVFIFFVLNMAALVMSDPCSVVPMTEWAGEESKHKDDLISPVPLVVIHHSVYKPCHTDEECLTVIRGIRQYHMNKLGFNDIGDAFLVGGNGLVYEGSGWKHVGAHTRRYNNRSIDISFLGDFRKVSPTLEALQAAKGFLSCAEKNGYLPEDYQLVGHQQLSKTESPGAMLQKEIETWPHWVKHVD